MAAERALITGGAGFIGSHLARALLEDGWEVTLVDDHSRPYSEDGLGPLAGQAQSIEQDLTRTFDRRLSRIRPDVVFHLAAIVGVRRTTERPAQVLRDNVCALQNVISWCADAKPHTFFFSSTSEVADGAVASGLADVPVDEEVPFVCSHASSPRASYAMSKAYGEALLKHIAGEQGLRVRIARYFNVYGPRMGSEHVIPEIIGRVLDGQDPLAIYGADASRAFCYVDDAVRATIALVGLTQPEPLLVNVGNDSEEIVIGELVRRILKLAGVRPELDVHLAPVGSPARRCPDTSRLRELTGIGPRVGLEQGLRLTYEWYASALAGARYR